jgi:hypothetical protein
LYLHLYTYNLPRILTEKLRLHDSIKPFLLGFCNHTNTRFKGKISELKIYDTSIDEIKDNLDDAAIKSGVLNEIQKPEIINSIRTKFGENMEHFQLQYEIVQLVREKIGAVASLRDVVLVQRLPKTRSGKILRKLLRSIADGENFQIPSTIDDEAIIEEVRDEFIKAKIGSFK